MRKKKQRYSAFQTNLNNLMRDEGITQQKLADEIGVDRSTVGYYAAGQSEPTLDGLVQIAKYLGASVDYLLGLSTEKAIDPNIRQAAKTTGLSEEAVEAIMKIPERSREGLELILRYGYLSDATIDILRFIADYIQFPRDLIEAGRWSYIFPEGLPKESIQAIMKDGIQIEFENGVFDAFKHHPNAQLLESRLFAKEGIVYGLDYISALWRNEKIEKSEERMVSDNEE